MREEYAPQPTADDTNRGMAESARKADIESAVRREKAEATKSGFQLSDEAALQNVYTRIDVDGVEAVLPQFARITARMRGTSFEGDDVPRTVRTYSSTRPGDEDPASAAPSEAEAARSEIMKLNAANSSDLAAGRSPDPARYARIEELRQKL